MNKINLIQGDCLEKMKQIDDKSIDMILCDLPYGTTACKWDEIIPFDKLWEQYNRIIKDNGVIVLFSSEPFTSKLISSNINNFKYKWIWEKQKASNFMLAKKQPLKNYEEVCVFYNSQCTYNPQLQELTEEGKKRNNRTQNGNKNNLTDTVYGDMTDIKVMNYKGKTQGYPKMIVKFNTVVNNQFKKCLVHPTQKPIDLLEYLINTYTNEGQTVLDNTMGSCSTGIACINTRRNFIGIELDNTYFETCKNRVNEHIKDNNLQDIHIEIA